MACGRVAEVCRGGALVKVVLKIRKELRLIAFDGEVKVSIAAAYEVDDVALS